MRRLTPALIALLLAALVWAGIVPVTAASASAAPAATTVVLDAGGHVIATSRPARYALGGTIPIPSRQLAGVLDGARPASGETALDGRLVRWSLAPIVSAGQPGGAVYVETPLTPAPDQLALVVWAVAVALGALVIGGRALVLRERGAREDERRRLAGRLHDSVSQDLSGIRLELAALAGRPLPDGDLRDRLARLDAASGDAIRQLRGLLLELRPPSSDGLDLETALRDLALSYGSRLGIAVELRIGRAAAGARARDALVGVAREALANVARHAGARRVEIDLSTDGRRAVLAIRDDGRGFEPAAARRGLGLRLARERTEAAGGVLELASEPGGGTTVTAAVPL